MPSFFDRLGQLSTAFGGWGRLTLLIIGGASAICAAGYKVGLDVGTEHEKTYESLSQAGIDKTLHDMRDASGTLRGDLHVFSENRELRGQLGRAQLELSHLNSVETELQEANRRLAELSAEKRIFKLTPGNSVHILGDGSNVLLGLITVHADRVDLKLGGQNLTWTAGDNKLFDVGDHNYSCQVLLNSFDFSEYPNGMAVFETDCKKNIGKTKPPP